MNGPIAQLVALTCHANSFLRSGGVVPATFSLSNSTCKFCDRVSFVEIKKSWLGKSTEKTTAENPSDWFRQLLACNASSVRIVRQSRNDPAISDRMSAGFVGGGGTWLLLVSYSSATECWMSRWEVWNQNEPEQKIWRVTYGLVARNPSRPPSDPDYLEAKATLESALVRIHAFSQKHNCGGFTECFARAMDSLRSGSVAHGYHKDLFVPGSLSKSDEAMLDAAQSAWVFGGMGSWNDMGFDGEDQREYESVSEQLFAALTSAICVAANAASREPNNSNTTGEGVSP